VQPRNKKVIMLGVKFKLIVNRIIEEIADHGVKRVQLGSQRNLIKESFLT
jgi:hypothetical protein